MKYDEKIKQMFPDFSGEYNGKLNDKKSSNDGKISNNATVRKKA